MQEITQNFQVQTGDIVQFDYSIISLWEQSQINTIISRMNRDPRMSVVGYEVERSTWYSDILHIQVKIAQNPFPIILIVLAIGAIATSLFVYLSLNKIYLVSREAPQVVSGITSTISLGFIAVIAIAGFFLIRTFKG